MKKMCKIANIQEHQSMLREAFKRLIDTHSQKVVIEAAGLSQTVASGNYHGRKGIGDETIEKLDLAYPNWRDTDSPPAKQVQPRLNLDFKGIAEFKRQLNLCFDGMSVEHKEIIVSIANKLYDLDNHQASIFNPSIKKKVKEND